MSAGICLNHGRPALTGGTHFYADVEQLVARLTVDQVRKAWGFESLRRH